MISLQKSIYTVLRDASFYGVASVLARSVTLLTFPMLARHLSIEEYGVFDLFYVSITVVITLFIFGQDSSLLRYFHDEEDDDGRKQLVTQTLVFQVVIALAVLVASYLVEDVFIQIFEISEQLQSFVHLMIIIIPFGILYTISEVVLRLTSDLKGFLALTLGFMLTMLSVVFFGTQVINADLEILLEMYVWLWSFFGFFGLFLIRRWLVIPTGVFSSSKMLIYGLPMGLVVLVETVQPVIERLIITNTLTSVSLGLYAAAAKVSMILLLPIGAFQMAFMPLAMKIYRDQSSINLFNLVLKIYTTLLSVLVLLIAVLSEDIIMFLAGGRYIESAPIVFPITLSIYFWAISGVLGLGGVISNKTYLRLIIHVAAQIFAYSLMITLSVGYDIWGVAVAVAAGKGMMLLLYSFMGQKVYPLDWNYRVVVIMIFITVAYGFYLSLQGISSITALIFFAGTIFAILFIGWSFLTYEDRDALRNGFSFG